MVVRKPGVLRDARGGAVRGTGAEEVVRPREHCQRRRARRVCIDHVQDRFLGRISEVVGDRLRRGRVRIRGRQAADVSLEGAHHRRCGGRVAGQVELGSAVRLERERGRVPLLRRQQAGQVARQLAEAAGRVGAEDVGRDGCAADRRPVAVRGRRLDRPAHVRSRLVVTLVGADDEQRVGGGDAVSGHA